MNVGFVKTSPTQNMTILVTDEIARELQKNIAEKLMRYDSVFAEQVGFIERPKQKEAVARLQMMGGEFCGNATLSLGAYLVSLQKKPVGAKEIVKLEVSGSDEPVDCSVCVLEEGYKCNIKMPPPELIEEQCFTLCGNKYFVGVVYFQGITHLIIDTSKYSIDKETFAEAVVTQLTLDSDAVGIMFFDPQNSEITPFVHVRPTNSKIWERGCGSGSAALGAYLSYKNEASGTFAVKQPGGKIEVHALYKDGTVGEVYIEGIVRIVATGVAYIT